MEKDIEVRARTSVLRRLRSSPRHERVRLYTNHNRPALRANAYLQVWAETERGAVVAVEARLTLEMVLTLRDTLTAIAREMVDEPEDSAAGAGGEDG
jgi:hypothetical protein